MTTGTTLSGQSLSFRPVEDKSVIAGFLIRRWGNDGVVVMGKVWSSKDMNALAAYNDTGQLMAIACWVMRADILLLTSIDSVAERTGVASALLEAIIRLAKREKAKRIRAVVTNENFDAMRFYQRRKFRFTALYVSAADAYRAVFQNAPKTGAHGIPVSDTLELELVL